MSEEKLPTPQAVAHDLELACLTEDQANAVAAEVYQPLLNEIENLKKALVRIICWDINLGEKAQEHLLKEVLKIPPNTGYYGDTNESLNNK